MTCKHVPSAKKIISELLRSSTQQRLDTLTGAIVYKVPVLVEMKSTGFAWMGGA